MEYFGEPTQKELDEMLYQNKLMSTGVSKGLSEDQILERRFKKLDQLIKGKISTECLDLVHKIFALSPKQRISAEEALRHPYFASVREEGWKKKEQVVSKQN